MDIRITAEELVANGYAKWKIGKGGFAPGVGMDGKVIYLVPESKYNKLPKGTELYSINGKRVIKGKDKIDDDTRGGYLAYGIMPDE